MSEKKSSLTAKERIKAAYLAVVRDVDNQEIAVAFEVNHGRVSEAVQAIELAARHPMVVLEALKELK